VDLELVKYVCICGEWIKVFMNNDAVYDIKAGEERMEGAFAPGIVCRKDKLSINVKPSTCNPQ